MPIKGPHRGFCKTPRTGFADYADTATALDPIALSAAAGFVELTNDALGANTQDRLPDGVFPLWDPETDAFDFSSLEIGDQLLIRFDLTLTLLHPNTVISSVAALGIGEAEFELALASSIYYKLAGTYDLVLVLPAYIGSSLVRDNPARVKIKSDAAASCVVKGWYIRLN